MNRTLSKSIAIYHTVFFLLFLSKPHAFLYSASSFRHKPWRVDYTSLSDQTLMELLFEGFDEDTQQRYQDSDGTYLDVFQWACVKCDKERSVIQISRSGCTSGSLHLRYLPPKFQSLQMSYTGLAGSIDLTHLPQTMANIYLVGNVLTGSIELNQLPETLELLSLGSNMLVGCIDLAHLPREMFYLGLGNNKFEGSIDLTQLPESMHYIYLQYNRLSGSFHATNLPPNLGEIDASGNKFRPTAVVDSRTRAKFRLCNAGVVSVVDQNGFDSVSQFRI